MLGNTINLDDDYFPCRNKKSISTKSRIGSNNGFKFAKKSSKGGIGIDRW